MLAVLVPMKLLDVCVPELLTLLLLRTTPPITLLVFAVEPVIVPAKVRFVLDKVTPPITLLTLD